MGHVRVKSEPVDYEGRDSLKRSLVLRKTLSPDGDGRSTASTSNSGYNPVRWHDGPPVLKCERLTDDIVIEDQDSDVELGVRNLDSSACDSRSRRQFRCIYCDIVSKWNRRDIRLHIMHVHMQRRVYSCRYCAYGNSKSSAVVMGHCARVHPGRPVSVRDELGLFNAIVPFREHNNIISVAFLRPDGTPVVELSQLKLYLAGRKAGSSFGQTYKAPEQRPVAEMQINEQLQQKRRMLLSSLSDASLSTLPPGNAIGTTAVVSGAQTYLASSDAAKTSVRGNQRPDLPLDLSVKVSHVVSSPTAVATPKGTSRGAGGSTSDVIRVSATSAGGSSVEGVWVWKCKLCAYQHVNGLRVKHHLVCHHLQLKPYSCPHCRIYLWKAQAVSGHINKCHAHLGGEPMATIDERAAYVVKNMHKIRALRSADTAVQDGDRWGPGRAATIYRCNVCGFQDVRNDKTKYHVIKAHLKLGLFSCHYCHKYMWGRLYVIRHIEQVHPGEEVRIRRTFEEYEDYLKQHITKIGSADVINSGGGGVIENGGAIEKALSGTKADPVSTVIMNEGPSSVMLNVPAYPFPTSSSSASGSASRTPTIKSPSLMAAAKRQYRCEICSFITDTEMSLTAHRRTHRAFQCFHCDYQHTLAARVQSHCLAQHPTQPVKYTRCQVESIRIHRAGDDGGSDTEKGSPSPRVIRSPIPIKRIKMETPDESVAQVSPPSSNRQPAKIGCSDLASVRDKGSAQDEIEEDEDDEAPQQDMYVCRYCRQLTFNIDDMRVHLRRLHPREPPEFELLQESVGNDGDSDNDLSGGNVQEIVGSDCDDNASKMKTLASADIKEEFSDDDLHIGNFLKHLN